MCLPAGPARLEAGIASDACHWPYRKPSPKCLEGGIENISIFRAAGDRLRQPPRQRPLCREPDRHDPLPMVLVAGCPEPCLSPGRRTGPLWGGAPQFPDVGCPGVTDSPRAGGSTRFGFALIPAGSTRDPTSTSRTADGRAPIHPPRPPRSRGDPPPLNASRCRPPDGSLEALTRATLLFPRSA
jgi:hypothetical protein